MKYKIYQGYETLGDPCTEIAIDRPAADAAADKRKRADDLRAKAEGAAA